MVCVFYPDYAEVVSKDGHEYEKNLFKGFDDEKDSILGVQRSMTNVALVMRRALSLS